MYPRILLAASLLMAIPSPASAENASPPSRTLYERLGGGAGLEMMVSRFVRRTIADPRVARRFVDVDPDRLERAAVEFMCGVVGGRCSYRGTSLPAAAAGLELVDAEVDVITQNLIATLDEFDVGKRERDELLASVEHMRALVVAQPDTLHPLPADQLAQVRAWAERLGDDRREARGWLLAAAAAGERGQRAYAEQLFSRAELLTGAARLGTIASVFRSGAPPRATGKLTVAIPVAPLPAVLGFSDEDELAADRPRRGKRGTLGGAVTVDGAPLDGVGVVTLTPEHPTRPRPPAQRVLELRGMRMAPRILAVPVGSTVAFPNFDTVPHNVFSRSSAEPFDVGFLRPDEQREMTFDTPGLIHVGCSLHTGESAYIAVVDAPHFAAIGPGGSFDFDSLLIGRYTATIWTDRTPEPQSVRITIAEGKNRNVLDVRGAEPRVPGTDKFGVTRTPPSRTITTAQAPAPTIR